MPEFNDANVERALKDIQNTQKEFTAALHSVNVSLARLDERQKETTDKIAIISTTLSNNFVGAVEFGILKKDVQELEQKLEKIARDNWDRQDKITSDYNQKIKALADQRENDRTWFIRWTITGAVAGLIGYLRLKGGL